MTVTDQRPVSWRDRALCREMDPELFWLDSETDDRSMRSWKIKKAKQACRSCPVWQECRDWGIQEAFRDRWSILGGLGPIERRRLRMETQEWN